MEIVCFLVMSGLVLNLDVAWRMTWTKIEWSLDFEGTYLSHFLSYIHGLGRKVVMEYLVYKWHMGWVMEVWLSCYLVLLSADSKTW